MTRGGKRKGAGRPRGTFTTHSSEVKPVFYRVSKAQRRELDKAGAKKGLTGNQEAKRRAFPALPQSQGGG